MWQLKDAGVKKFLDTLLRKELISISKTIKG